MNEYKITYSGESEGYRLVVDRTEAAAKKYFREQAKELDLGRITIDDVELVSDVALATKRNERETLEVIRQLVADLGEQSYLATAFQGCFEIAEENIENDFADSLRGRLDGALSKIDKLEAQIEELKDQLSESQKDWEASHAANHVLAEEKDAEIASLRARVLSEEDLERVVSILGDRVSEAEEMAEKAASEIVRLAEDPASREFQRAVSMHRNHSTYAKSIRELLGRVDSIRATNHAGA